MLFVLEFLLLFMFLIFLIYIPIKGALNDSKGDKEFSVYSFIERTIASFVGGLLIFGGPFVILVIVFGESATPVESSITHECSEAGIFDSDNCDEYMENKYGPPELAPGEEWGPGAGEPDYTDSDRYHGVDSNGDGIDDHIRSNPDNFESNNINYDPYN